MLEQVDRAIEVDNVAKQVDRATEVDNVAERVDRAIEVDNVAEQVARTTEVDTTEVDTIEVLCIRARLQSCRSWLSNSYEPASAGGLSSTVSPAKAGWTKKQGLFGTTKVVP